MKRMAEPMVFVDQPYENKEGERKVSDKIKKSNNLKIKKRKLAKKSKKKNRG